MQFTDDLTYPKRYALLDKEERRIWERIENNYIANWTEFFTQKAERFAENIVVRETQSGASFTYRQLAEASDAVADFIRAHVTDERVGLYHENSFLFLAALIGINKTGRLAVLFNTNEPPARVAEMVRRSGVQTVFGNAIDACRHYAISEVIATPTQAPIHIADLKTTLENPAFVIFTSGTSGPSKPALFSHRRMIGAGVAWSLRTFMKESHNCYITLPLYHGNALAVAFSAVVTVGATATLRPKFSVTHFFDDIEKFGCTHMVYIGELWRYLLQRHPHPRKSSLHTIFGNGLHKALWREVVSRYGITHVVEHFGATEMPASALTNWMDVPGYCGYIPPKHPDNADIALIDEHGDEVAYDTPGEAIFRVPNNRYRGYLDPALDKPKIFMRDGVQWWRSGDLLKRNREGFFTFIDRVGDSYRFKGENIASADVEKVLMQSGLFEEAVVYGIKFTGIEGKIGMASVVAKEALTPDRLQQLLEHLKKHLAPYAFPYFLRLRSQKHATTSTLKIQKKSVAEEGVKACEKESCYLLHEGAYIPITEAIYHQLQTGQIVPGKRP